MAKRKIHITVADLSRLGRMLVSAISQAVDSGPLEALEIELEKAQLVRPEQIPADVITMNSKVRISNLDTKEERVITLVFPDDENTEEDKISVLSPIGTALLGYRTGDRIKWKCADTTLNLKVEEIVYQPEAEGNFRL